jgi:hypothetical protein
MAYNPGKVDTTYVSSLEFLQDRDVIKKMLDTKHEADFLDIMQVMGRMKAADQEDYEHTENDLLFSSVEVASVSGGTTAASDPDVDALVTIAATSHTNGGKDSHPIVGEEVLLTNRQKGRVVAKDESADGAHTITIRPAQGEDIVNNIAAGDILSFPNSAHAEGKGSPKGRKSNVLHFKNNTMRLKSSYQITVDQKVTKLFFELEGKPYFMAKGQHDALLQFQLQEAFALLTSTGGTYIDEDGDKVRTTKGLDKSIRDGGIVHSFVNGIGYEKEDLRAINKKLDRENAPDDFLFALGSNLDMDVDDVFRSMPELTNGAISWDAFGSSNAKQRAIDLGIDSYRVYGRTFHKKKLKALNHKGITGVSDTAPWPNTGYMIPTNKVKAARGGEVLDRIRVRYRKGDGVSLDYHEAWTGKYAPTGATNDISEARAHYEAHKGLQIVGTNHMVALGV